MQRRAVAVYAAFFLIIAAGSYTLLATAEEPTIALEDADYQLSENETFTVGGQEYTATSIEEGDNGGGSGSLEWTESDVEMTETWANESTVEIDDTEWTVRIGGNAENATSFTFQEVVDRQAILESDPNAANETVESGGQEYVVVETGGDEELVAVDEYFPAPTTVQYSTGESFAYNNQTVTVDEIGMNGVTVSWTEDQTNTNDLSHEGTTELADGNGYLVFFPGDGTVMLTQDTSSYDAQVESQQQFSERTTGLRYVIFTTVLFAFSLIAFGFLPSRY
jgi:hypothetical protein